jgi:hypothetical protein
MIDSNLQERFDSARTHVPEKEQVIIHATDSNLVDVEYCTYAEKRL